MLLKQFDTSDWRSVRVLVRGAISSFGFTWRPLKDVLLYMLGTAKVTFAAKGLALVAVLFRFPPRRRLIRRTTGAIGRGASPPLRAAGIAGGGSVDAPPVRALRAVLSRPDSPVAPKASTASAGSHLPGAMVVLLLSGVEYFLVQFGDVLSFTSQHAARCDDQAARTGSRLAPWGLVSY